MPSTTATLSIRDRIRGIQTQLVAGTFTPQLVRTNLLELTGLLGLVMQERRDADHDYNVVLDALTTEMKAVSRARVRAAITAEHQRSREALDVERLVLQMIMASKKYLESLDNEMRFAG